MTKEQFFGRCIGQSLKVPDEKEAGLLTTVNVQGVAWFNNDCDYDISDCQIIGRRIIAAIAYAVEKYGRWVTRKGRGE